MSDGRLPTGEDHTEMIFGICNPVSRRGDGLAVSSQVEGYFREEGIPYRTLYTAASGDGTRLAHEAAAAGAETVFAIGGDGTASEVARGLAGTDCPFGIVPAGTGNDFARALGLPSDPMEALKYQLGRDARRIDLMDINGRVYMNETGMGYDVETIRTAQRMPKFIPGSLAYFMGVVSTLLRFRAVGVVCSFDGDDEVRLPCFLIAVCNGGYIGGGIRIGPRAAVDDGLLDVVIIKEITRGRLLPRLAALMRGRVLDFPETEFRRCRRFSVRVPGRRIDINADGEIFSVDRVDVELLPEALLVRG